MLHYVVIRAVSDEVVVVVGVGASLRTNHELMQQSGLDAMRFTHSSRR